MPDLRYPCPCCGHLVFQQPPGSEDICLVCFWEDDAVQLRFARSPDGANVPCLQEAQQNVLRFGAIEERFAGDVRPPEASEPKDPEWRPIDSSDSFEDAEDGSDGPADPTALYYWRRSFWRQAMRRN